MSHSFTRKSWLIVFRVLLLLLLATVPVIEVCAQSMSTSSGKGLVVVEVEGSVPEEVPNARWVAIKRAMLEAIRSVAGMYLEGGTSVINEETKTFLEVRTSGYVAKWQVQEESVTNGQYRVRLKAFVRDKPIYEDLALYQNLPLKAVYQWIGRPKLAVNIVDYVAYESKGPAQPYEVRPTQRKLQEALLEKGIELVVPEEKVWQDPLQTQFQIAILGKSITRINQIAQPPPPPTISQPPSVPPIYIYYNALELEVKKVGLPRSELQVAGFYENLTEGSSPGGLTPDAAVLKAVMDNIRNNLGKIVGQIVKAWYQLMHEPRTITVQVKNVEAGKISKEIYAAVAALSGVEYAGEPVAIEGGLQFDVRYHGTPLELDEILTRKIRNLEYSGSTDRFLSYRVSGAGTPVVAKPVYRVGIKGLSLQQSEQITNLLKQRLEITSVKYRGLEDGCGKFEITYSGSKEDLADIIERVSGSVVQVQIKSCSEDEIEGLATSHKTL